jgi:hypothetical protein
MVPSIALFEWAELDDEHSHSSLDASVVGIMGSNKIGSGVGIGLAGSSGRGGGGQASSLAVVVVLLSSLL